MRLQGCRAAGQLQPPAAKLLQPHEKKGQLQGRSFGDAGNGWVRIGRFGIGSLRVKGFSRW